MATYESYQALRKPFFAPPAWIFGPVWSVLYLIILASFGYVFVLYFRGKISAVILLPFIINLAANFSFTYFQFRLKNNLLAAIDISIVVASLIWAMTSILPISAAVAYVQLPYLAWCLFATTLQFSVTYLNR